MSKAYLDGIETMSKSNHEEENERELLLNMEPENTYIKKVAEKAWYALRRTLVPWRFDELLRELSELSKTYCVDEVIIKIDTEEFSHGHFPIAQVRELLPRLKQVKAVLQEQGICFSINPWLTLGHADRSHCAAETLPGAGTMTGHNGKETRHCTCPLSTVWQDYMVEVWECYAELQPDVMWIEDDIRTFNHAPVDYGCFCDLHLQRFEEKTGMKVSREELVGHILASGNPHPFRQEYLAMQGEITNEVVGKISAAVCGIAPGTRIGLMSSGPFTHVLEGRDWKGLTAATNSHPLVSRPPLFNYSETSLRGLYESQQSIKLTRAALPGNVIEMTEVENIPFTQYAKSNTFTFLQMALSFALGCEGVTLNLFDHRGSFMAEDPGAGKMLAAKKKFLCALKKAAVGPGTYRGAQLLFNPGYSNHKILDAKADYSDLAVQDETASDMLEPLGIPTTYGHSPVTVVSGQMLRGFSDEAIQELLAGGLLIDCVAAGILLERGFGKQIGLASASRPTPLEEYGPVAAEAYFNPDLGGDANCFLTTFLPEYGRTPRISHLEPLASATVVSRLVDADRNPKETVLYIAENDLGGRVAVYAYELASAVGTGFYHFYRRRQIQHLMRWLSAETFPAMVHNAVYPLLICKDMQERTFCTLFNLSLDPYESAKIELYDPRMLSGIQGLNEDGCWQKSDELLTIETTGNRHTIQIHERVECHQPICLEITWILK